MGLTKQVVTDPQHNTTGSSGMNYVSGVIGKRTHKIRRPL